MPKPDVGTINREKLLFAGAAALSALALHAFVTTCPVRLVASAPLSSEPGPASVTAPEAPLPLPVSTYVRSGTDPISGQFIKRDRNTPFAPRRSVSPRPSVVPAHQGEVSDWKPPKPPQPSPCQETSTVQNAVPKASAQPQARLVASVDYVGIVETGGTKVGLLRPKDGGAPLRVRVGERIGAYDYTVTRIEGLAIWVADKDGTPFILRNSRFAASPH